jgi:uncharacterized protein (DUF2126 family)
MQKIAEKIASRLSKSGVHLTLGGEPSYVPVDPAGPEWNFTAAGPTKLEYAWKLADALTRHIGANGVTFYSPGKSYPGETNPRWALNILWNRDGSPLAPARTRGAAVSLKSLTLFKRGLLSALGVRGRWLPAKDLSGQSGPVFVLPLDHDGTRWVTESWPTGPGRALELFYSDGPAGLRLPLNTLPPDALRRALTLEVKENRLHIFFPPLMQPAFLELLGKTQASLQSAGIGSHRFEGYIPSDEKDLWRELSLTPDPGVLEVNLPPCASPVEYSDWMNILEKCTAKVGLRSFKQVSDDHQTGTGGGNHLLFGGPDLESTAFFRYPGWITSMLRYWQHHPSLSYLFTGDYVGPSSQAPRPDESGRDLYDLEMAYQFLEGLEQGLDQRYLISETLRHLHTDSSGNTHRSEMSFDKFWNTAFAGGCRGLVEFRAVETLPHAGWMSAVATLWQALAAHLFKKPFREPLIDHGSRLHDYYFMPSAIWDDFHHVLGDLKRDGLGLDESVYRAIWAWRFPLMLTFENADAQLVIRKGCEGWPLLCETPIEGGSTSRFVDTSMDRIEFSANKRFVSRCRVFAQGRELKLEKFPGGKFGAGLRYRRTALYPSLHPGVAPHMPLFVTIADGKKNHAYRLDQQRRVFAVCDEKEAPSPTGVPCKKLKPDLVTCDLRIPS